MGNPVDPLKIKDAFEMIGFDVIPPRGGMYLFIRASSPLATVMIDFNASPDKEEIEERLTASVDESIQAEFWKAFDAL